MTRATHKVTPLLYRILEHLEVADDQIEEAFLVGDESPTTKELHRVRKHHLEPMLSTIQALILDEEESQPPVDELSQDDIFDYLLDNPEIFVPSKHSEEEGVQNLMDSGFLSNFDRQVMDRALAAVEAYKLAWFGR
jgi:hypothetical protein